MLNPRKGRQTRSNLGRFFAAALLSLAMGSLPSAFAHHSPGHGGGGGGGGGGTDGDPPCVTFDDAAGHKIQSDNGTPYCDNKSAKVAVGLSQDGHFSLDTNSSNKTGVGRSLSIDFGTPITVTDTTGTFTVTFTDTDELETLLPEGPIIHDAAMHIGPWQDSFNMFSMAVGGSEDVNLVLNLFLHFPGVKLQTPVFIKLAPNPVGNGRFCAESDPVTITCDSLDVNGDCNAWTVTTAIGAQACVSEQPFGTNTLGLHTLPTGMTITSGVPSAQGQGGGGTLPEFPFLRGDANADGKVDIADGVATLGFLFGGDQAPSCLDAADTDDSGQIDIADSIGIFNFLFLNGVPPAPPGRNKCGEDPTDDGLSCNKYSECP